MIALHLLWISLKGLLVYLVVFGAGTASTYFLFGSPPSVRYEPWDALPGFMGGGVLLFILVFGGLYILLGGRT